MFRSELLSRISLVNYFGNDGSLGFLDLVNEADGEVRFRKGRWCELPTEQRTNQQGIEGVVMLKGSTQGLGDFTIRIEDRTLTCVDDICGRRLIASPSQTRTTHQSLTDLTQRTLDDDWTTTTSSVPPSPPGRFGKQKVRHLSPSQRGATHAAESLQITR